MKNKVMIGTVVGTVVVGSLGGVAAFAASNDSNSVGQPGITAERALEIAFDHTEGTVQEVELSFEEDGNYYEIEIASNTSEYEFNVDAVKGEILDQHAGNVEQEEEEDNPSDNGHYPNEPADVASFEEYGMIVDQVNTDGLTFHLSTDNQGNRIMFLVSEDGKKQYKTIFVKYDQHLKIIDVNNGGLVYNGTI
ncbi:MULTISPECIES: PepSY domain-containing protein [Planococcus]|uniref:PepSY domain-containing protein n=1 Tax=Planococcus faecalis TaxID=1598147 RepID=A0ABN4XJ68_9BACL|nr:MULTISPECIES: PepSY domain-containing protein [Planococcus]AQU78503.1 hypothetical protein AJGP001_03960 [Planococcus faecalis]MDJ0331534.1 PepSY domain-containing protein [Planococcus sp. S3-L1]OHX51492.1 hypothetical protein BB777_16805 [Planococcus faecalis]